MRRGCKSGRYLVRHAQFLLPGRHLLQEEADVLGGHQVLQLNLIKHQPNKYNQKWSSLVAIKRSIRHRQTGTNQRVTRRHISYVSMTGLDLNRFKTTRKAGLGEVFP